MRTSKKQITEKTRKADLLMFIIIEAIGCIYFGLRWGYFFVTLPEGEEKTIIQGFIAFMENFAVKPWQIFPTSPICVLLLVFVAAIIGVILYNKYLIVKDTVENAHGDAAFETDYDEYEREFVVDPSIVGRMLGRKLTDKENPRNEEGKKVVKFIKAPYSSKKYADIIAECRRNAMVYSNTIYLSLNGGWCQRNTNSIVFGASGTGKSRYFLKPNILQANGSFICTDPSGDIMQDVGYFLEKVKGYKIKCFNIDDMTKSARFNPLYYIRDTKDIAIIVNTFLENVNGEKKSSGGDGDFWTQSSKALMCAVIGYLYEVCPMEQRNFSNVLEIIRLDGRSENDDANVETDFDVLFQNLGEANPASFAYQQYRIFKQAPAKTALNIIISTSVTLSQMDIPEVKNLTYKDEMELDKVGEELMAIFLVIPQADATYCWLTAMFYSLLFKRLYKYGEGRMKQSAEDEANGVIDPATGKVVKGLSNPEMKIPVRFLIDECANVGKIPNIEKYLATCRKYRISIIPIFQNYSQIEEVYGKEKANNIVSNCDAFLFLGGSDESTLKIIQSHLGKETVKTLSNGYAISSKGSNSANKQQTGKDLMTRDQIETMSNADCLLFIRALRPFKTPKYKLETHPNYKYLSEGGQGKSYPNPFNLEYEDEQIEDIRIKTADEVGYIAPEIVDSARRRNLIETNKKKAAELHELIEELRENLACATSDKEIEKIKAQIKSVEAEIKKLERTDPDKQNEEEVTEKMSDIKPCAETKTPAEALKDNPVVSQNDLKDIVDTKLLDSYSPTYEFDIAKDFVLEGVTSEPVSTDDTLETTEKPRTLPEEKEEKSESAPDIFDDPTAGEDYTPDDYVPTDLGFSDDMF